MDGMNGFLDTALATLPNPDNLPKEVLLLSLLKASTVYMDGK